MTDRGERTIAVEDASDREFMKRTTEVEVDKETCRLERKRYEEWKKTIDTRRVKETFRVLGGTISKYVMIFNLREEVEQTSQVCTVRKFVEALSLMP